jgi:hypothetical protein
LVCAKAGPETSKSASALRTIIVFSPLEDAAS